MRYDGVGPIHLERVDEFEETSFIASFLGRQIHIPNNLISSLRHSNPLKCQKVRLDLLHPELVLIPRRPLQIVHNTPCQCSYYINALTDRYQDCLHVISIVTAPNRIKYNICLNRLEQLKRFREAEFRDCDPASWLPRILNVVQESGNPVGSFVEPGGKGVSCGPNIPSARGRRVGVGRVNANGIERVTAVTCAGFNAGVGSYSVCSVLSSVRARGYLPM